MRRIVADKGRFTGANGHGVLEVCVVIRGDNDAEIRLREQCQQWGRFLAELYRGPNPVHQRSASFLKLKIEGNTLEIVRILSRMALDEAAVGGES